MATHRQPPPLRTDGAPGNGKPGVKPYVYQGNGDSAREEQVEAFLASARARIAARQGTARAFHAELPGDADGVIPEHHDWPDGDHNYPAARARVVVVPISPDGRCRPWRGAMPPQLAARLAAVKQPLAAGPPSRCRRCGYVRTRCSCRRATMTRAGLEALIWRHARMLTGTPTEMRQAMDAILAAADAYVGTTLGEIDTYRRQRQPVVHWQRPGAPPSTPICHSQVTLANVTTRADQVTCGNCQQARAWQQTHTAVTR